MRIAVITVSDRASAGVYADRSGPAVVETLKSALPGAEIEAEIVPDGEESVLAALSRHPEADWILTTGGTGPAPRDRTPEATRAYCDRSMPGIADYLRSRSLEETPNAVFSRGEAGMRGLQYVVNFPGSEKAARFCAAALAPLMEHGRKMARGEGH
ncbi:MAG TPA: MogA/MoaB family molybdenum cofactor biosynthesis protein [Spirochaetia bacterium]|nr:MogA/MoaB family molybdenum cofactor biosynthesis protein [Spirochaetales bacterium]HRY71643.1 MogA/MoaB family molybdenum cofactor biosynthesis protein [Spirochaetia bacterium]